MPPQEPSHFTVIDLFFSFIYVSIIVLIYSEIKTKNSAIPYYRFFLSGMLVKILGVVVLCYVYMYHYAGGDTTSYFLDAKILGNLFWKNPDAFFKIVFLNDISSNTFSYFNSHTGWPYYQRDAFSFFFVRLITPLDLLSFGNYTACSILLAVVSYSGAWKLYTVLCKQFPSLIKEMAIAILFMPSVTFFGSGILKDTISLSCLGWFVYGLYNILNKKYSLKYFLILLISGYLLLSIKPYILYGLLAASSVWCAAYYLKNISLPIIRYIYAPVILALFAIGSSLVIVHIGKERERFSIEEMGNEVTTRRAAVDPSPPGSKFTITKIENSFSSLVKSAPSVIATALYRPYVWETKRNIMMFCVALENSFLLIFFIILLYKFNIVSLLPAIFSHPFLIFSFFFVLILSFAVGISTNNFGTLVRFRIPVIPFYVAGCFILSNIHKMNSKGAPKQE